MSEKAG